MFVKTVQKLHMVGGSTREYLEVGCEGCRALHEEREAGVVQDVPERVVLHRHCLHSQQGGQGSAAGQRSC